MIKNFFFRILKFIKHYPGILYSFVLILILPLILYFNTFLTAKSFQENIDHSLQTKALMVENVLGVFLSDFFESPELLQEKLEKISQENPEIRKLSLVKEEEGEFLIIASKNSYEIGAKTQDPSLTLSFSQDQAIANLTHEQEERFWNVIKPVYDKEDNEKIGLIVISLSLQETDLLITKTIFWSYIIILVIILLTLFLVLQHTRLFGYVSLSKKLQEIDKMKDNFIRMATHELQSPIVNIRGYLGALEEEVGSSLTKEQKRLLEIAKSSAKNLSDLVYDILEVSRIEQGRLDFSPKLVSPSELIKEVIEELKKKAEEKKLDLILEIAETDYLVKVNPNRFRQILVNLIENAIKYTPQGKVSVSAKIDEAKKRYVIEVRDTGLGISAEAQKRLFERFYRVKTEKTAEISGTGLGLWITKQLCEKMDGNIFIESIEGTGTRFIVIFPLIKK